MAETALSPIGGAPVGPHRVNQPEQMPAGYAELLTDIKQRIRTAQVRAARAANNEVLRLYWSIGHDILVRQERDGWGAGVVDRLSRDLRTAFPGQRGWSPSNLRYMRRVAQAWPTEDAILLRDIGELPWGHIETLLDRLSSREDRDWYAARAVAEGWSRNVLEHFIKVRLRDQVGAAPTNFAATLDDPDAELAQQLVKDPYVFEHLALVERVEERNVEQALMDRLQDTLMEFGRGMSFVGRQVRIPVTDELGDTEEVVLDLLLFNIPQRRYVVVELKTGRFRPEYMGQLATYVAVVDGELRDPSFQAPPFGLLLCTGKNQAVVRYALAGAGVPMCVADYQGLPTDAQSILPSATQLENALQQE